MNKKIIPGVYLHFIKNKCNLKKMVGKAKPTPNKIVCVRRREGGSGSGWLGRSPYGLAPTPASTHSFAALVLL
ncbi:MAG: hypothetical protein FWG13_08615, partial [Leptospirales bacterium]|nr:hypothetical protein [Leptospirales bacterium]